MDAKALWKFLTDPTTAKQLFRGHEPPHWFGYLLAAILWLLLLSMVVGATATLKEPLAAFIKILKKLRRTPAQKETIRKRQEFAHFLKNEIIRMNSQENWDDRHFVDLQAEYYAGLPSSHGGIRRFFSTTSRGPQQKKDLLNVFQKNMDAFALIEGPPGSGKTVLLKQLALRICETAERSEDEHTPIALYINLKLLPPQSNRAVDQQFIYDFVIQQLKAYGNAALNQLVESEFAEGLRNGTWIFLFDSFDETPEVLRAEDSAAVIEEYAQAIYRFGTAFSRCRNLLASRRFRRPTNNTLPKFILQPLTDRQRDLLISKAILPTDAEKRLYSGIATASFSMQPVLENPMYLTIMIDHIRAGHDFPSTPYVLFDSYVEEQLAAQHTALRDRYGTTPKSISDFAELIAFTIAHDPTLGLNPTRMALLEAARTVATLPEHPQALLDALEAMRFARSDAKDSSISRRTFTFSHRRFHEYFLTSYLATHPDVLKPREILTDGNWREAALVLLTTNTADKLASLFAEIKAILQASVERLWEKGMLIEVPTDEFASSPSSTPNIFPWPAHCLHVLGLLQDAYSEDRTAIPSEIRALASKILYSVFMLGRLADRGLALEVAATCDDRTLPILLRAAIRFGSQLLDDIAFRQMRQLSTLPNDLERWIRLSLIERALTRRLYHEKRVLRVFISRIRGGNKIASGTELLIKIPLVEFGLYSIGGISWCLLPMSTADKVSGIAGIALASCMRSASWWLYRAKLGWASSTQSGFVYAINQKVASLLNKSSVKNQGERDRGLKVKTSVTTAAAVVIPLYLSGAVLIGVIGLVLGLSDSALDNLTLMTVIGSALFIVLWAPMAMAAIVDGEFVAQHWWPLLSFWPLIKLLAHPVKILQTAISWVGRNWRALCLILVFYSILTILALFPQRLPSNKHPIDWLSILVIGGPIAIIGWGFFRWVFNTIADLRRLHRIQFSEQRMSSRDFVFELAEMRTNKARIKLLQDTSARLRLPQGPATLVTIRDLSILLERELDRPLNDSPLEIKENSLSHWQENYLSENKGRLRAWGKSVLDELIRLEQRYGQLEMSRPTTD